MICLPCRVRPFGCLEELWRCCPSLPGVVRNLPKSTGRHRRAVVIATVLGTNLGIGLQQIVFQQLPVGPGVTLMSTAPVMALVAARFEGDPLQPRGIGAALLAVTGVAFTSLEAED